MLLLIQAYAQVHDCINRHWPFFLKSGADEIWIVTTTDDNDLSQLPKNVPIVRAGDNRYISGRHLPQRLIDTIKIGLGNKTKFQHICVCEYDTLFFKRLPIERMEHGIAAHRAGSQTWGSKANSFYHNPILFFREAAEKFVECGQQAINEGICDRVRGEADPPEASPDVFVGFVCEHYNIPIQGDLWSEYSRNSMDLPGHLSEARAAYKNGMTCVHGVKSSFELEFITA